MIKKILLLCPLTLCAAEYVCPEVSSISRTPGEYAWESKDGRWQGYFASPRIGRGDSLTLKSFQQSRWVQLNNLLDSPGVVECDYLGSYGDEIIRFVSSDSAAMPRPTSTQWNCDFNPDIPGTQCICSGQSRECQL